MFLSFLANLALLFGKHSTPVTHHYMIIIYRTGTSSAASFLWKDSPALQSQRHPMRKEDEQDKACSEITSTHVGFLNIVAHNISRYM
jgi:hypothetical protein